MNWLFSLLILGALVLVHEYGHFVVARRAGVRVERFSIGFGPILARWKRRDTEYVLSLLPLGGYVKMAGEQKSEAHNKPDEFLSKPAGIRALIVAAGPLVNWATSILALWFVLVVGYPELLPTVGKVMDKMPAQAAGLQVGDKITALNGERVRTWDEMTKVIHGSPDRPVAFQVERKGSIVDLTVTPQAKEMKDPFGRLKTTGLVGIVPGGQFDTYKLPPLEALKVTVQKQAEWTAQIGLSLWSLATGRIQMKESLTGPIGIIYMTSEAVQMGFSPVLYLIAILSLSLAIFNVFPIPALDGGHLLFIAIEKLRGKPVGLKVQERAAQVSMALLMVLVVFVCANDLQRLGVFEKLSGFFKAN